MIEPNQATAVVGESGSGKSTFINLVMRFYDPEFGEVLIDGVNVREYNIHDLRHRLGLVMQEPTLFNYSVKENVLYGNAKASNADIVNAVSIANASSFVESDTLQHRITDDPANLLENWLKPEYKDSILAEIGQETYDSYNQSLYVMT